MPDVVGTGVIRLETDEAGARASIDKFVADADAKLKTAGTNSGKSFGEGFASGTGQQLDATLQKAGNDLDNVKKKAETAGGKDKSQGLGILLTTAIALGPALVPLGAVAAAALGSIAVSAGVAALAYKGITAEIKAGTEEGKEYQAGINDVKSTLQGLEATAAKGVLGPFQDAVSLVTGELPKLNGLVGILASVLGEDATFAIDGLIVGFQKLEPLFLEIAKDSGNLFQDFDSFANGTGLNKFIGYVETELPLVEQTLANVGDAVVRLIQGFAPLGGGVLSEINLVSRAINAIPVNVLQVLVPIVTSGYLAFKAYDGLTSVVGVLEKIGGSFTGLVAPAVAAEGAATGVAAAETEAGVAAAGFELSLATALPVVGAIAVGVSLLATTFLGHNAATEKAKANIDSYTSAIEQDNYAIGTNTKEVLANNLVKDNAISSATKLGLSTQDVTDAIVQGGPALDSVTTKLKAIIAAGTIYASGASQAGFTAQAKAAQSLLGELTNQNSEINQASANAKIYQAALTSLGVTTDQVTTQTSQLGSEFTDLQTVAAKTANSVTTNLLGALDTFSKSAGTASDKATLLGQVLVTSQGDLLSYGGAIANGYQAVDKFAQSFDASEKAAINAKTGAIDYTKAGAAPLISSLQGIQSAAEQAAEATYGHEVATKGDSVALQDAQNIFESLTRGTLVDNQGQLSKTAKQLGLTKDAAKGLSDEYFTFDGKTVTTAVQAIGLPDINSTLQQIETTLLAISGVHTVTLDYDVKGNVITTDKKTGVTFTQVAANADGNVWEAYAGGGMRENHVAQIAPAGANRIWAEPETGGEAYIPLAPAKRTRSTAIWQETGKRLGATSSFADGGFSAGGGTGGGFGDLIDAINALASRPVTLEANGTQLARVVNNQQLTLNRGR